MKAGEQFVFTSCLFQAVLCREFLINLPESIEAVRGLCVFIPCSFDFNEQYEAQLYINPVGVWYKGDNWAKHKVFSSKTSEGNQIDGKIIGDLRRKNCTTIFYNVNESDSGEYYFRIVSGNLKYIYPSSFYLNVRGSPIIPSIRLYKEDQGEVEDQNEVVEGTSVRLICLARSPCPFNPPTFTWNFLPEDGTHEQNHNTRFSSSQLNFNATHLHHGLDFTCNVTYWLQNNTKSVQSFFMLHVLYGPRNMSVIASPSASVDLGSSVSLSCSSDANPAVQSYTWYRENGEHIGSGTHLTINETVSTHSGLYYCKAQNQQGEQKASVYLDVQYAPQISPFSSCNNAQDLIMCSCEVHGNPSPKLVWHLSGQTVLPSDSTSIQEESVGDTVLKSFITIHLSFLGTPTLQCIGVNNLGIDAHLFNLSKSECRHTLVPYLVLCLSVLLLLCVGSISFLIYKLKESFGKIKVLKSGNIYASLQLTAPNTYEIVQTHRERRL
ncbi:myelin-associated glycoprotein-like isoform X1 [Clarias gariepinus]|uniref:myelin-associated glycoprotein-like isoform X1 n=1 Tax=Clarias gariepinus TaxID=13013 RepID=UPI00234D129D|nr:myelin-associated glycoprotein-like isoform X1 [Clarias gariepinus]XP_053364159.1 myelin-associated glycoprotein-like isoform X1 [Clarias gariepinus]